MSYRARVHKSSRFVAILAAILVILWGTLIGFGYSAMSTLIPTAVLMIVAIAVFRLTGPRSTQQIGSLLRDREQFGEDGCLADVAALGSSDQGQRSLSC